MKYYNMKHLRNPIFSVTETNKNFRIKGKLCESRGRKAMGLPLSSDDRQAADCVIRHALCRHGEFAFG